MIQPFPEDPQIKRLREAYERHYAIARHELCVAPAASRTARRYRGARRERFLAVACDAYDRAATAVDLARACVDEANAVLKSEQDLMFGLGVRKSRHDQWNGAS